MINAASLRQKMNQSGYKTNYIANKLGITMQALLNKLNGKSEFKISEIQLLKETLSLTNEEINDIFLF